MVRSVVMDSTPSTAYQSDLDEYLASLDRVLPLDAVAGVYLTGSTALDQMHKTLQTGSQPHADACYISREYLRKQPLDGAAGHGHVVDGEFHRGLPGQELVLWASLDRHGITVRGPEAKSPNAAPDAGEFKAWNRGKLGGCERASLDRALSCASAGGVGGRQ